eukprot:1155311-Pelagomonas_calceolata.AAC.7
MFIEAVERGRAKLACQSLRLESTRCNRATKRCHKRQLFFYQNPVDMLFKKDSRIHAMLHKRQTSHITPVPTMVRNQHCTVIFEHNQQCRKLPPATG